MQPLFQEVGARPSGPQSLSCTPRSEHGCSDVEIDHWHFVCWLDHSRRQQRPSCGRVAAASSLPVIAKRSLPLQSSDLEEVASILLGLSRSDRRTALGQALSLVAPEQRWTVLRLGLVGPGLGHQLAGHIAALPVPIPEAEWETPQRQPQSRRARTGTTSAVRRAFRFGRAICADLQCSWSAFFQADSSASCGLTSLVASPKPKSLLHLVGEAPSSFPWKNRPR